MNDKSQIPKEELKEVVEMLLVFQSLPTEDRVAILYYIKGRIDATAGSMEIPILCKTKLNEMALTAQ